MNMLSPIERPDQLLGALRDKLGAAAVLMGTEVRRAIATTGARACRKRRLR
ncbi:D2hydroxyglutarate dehydrogenase CDS [Bradyrhizobium sp.]|nr:D2hydroxyglutarate dehydrogenase CDS [Bradyrhizobium sp.]